MKNIESLSIDISKYGEKAVINLIEAQRNTAKDILEDVKASAPVNTGAYKESINVSETLYENNIIKTSIYTDAIVSDSLGREYNLGELIEHGTRPHDIEPATKQTLVFTINGETIFAKHVFHPGTIANPHFQLSLQKNVPLYHNNISKALKEAK